MEQTGNLEDNEITLFTFEGTAGERIFLNNIDADFGETFSIYDSGNNRVFSSSSSGILTLENTGTYLLTLNTSFSSLFNDYNFELLVTETNTNTLNIGEIVEGNIESPGNREVYTFTGSVGQRVVFDGLDRDGSMSASFISPSGDTLFSSQNVNGDSNPITLLEAGNYELVIDGGFNNAIGDFSFQMLDVADAIALTANEEQMGAREFNEVTLFTYEGTAGERILFNRLGNISNQDFTVYNSANQEIFDTVNDTFNLETTGTYLVSVNPFNNSAEEYNFELLLPQTNITPLNIGEVVNGNIASPGNQEVYTFTGSVGQKVVFDGLSSDDINMNARLISPTGNTLLNSQNVNGDSNPITLLEAGTYELTINGGFNNATGDFSFQMLDVADATEITINEEEIGTLEGSSSLLFTFEGTAGERIFFNDLDDDFSESLTIYNAVNNFVASGLNSSFTPETSGTYLAVLANNNFSGTSEEYNFELLLPETTTNTLNIGDRVNGNIEAPGNRSLYTFDGSIGQKLVFDGLSSQEPNLTARLLSPSGDEIDLFNSFIPDNFLTPANPVTLLEAGTYELIVEGASGFSPIGDFSFQVLDVADATEITVGEGEGEMGTLEGNESKLFTFEGTAGERFFFNNLDQDSNESLRIYNGGNSLVGSGLNSSFTPETDGTYLAVLVNNTSNTSEEYNFELLLPETTTNTLDLGDRVNGEIAAPGNRSIHTFDGTIGQRIIIDAISSEEPNLTARLLSPSRDEIDLFNLFTFNSFFTEDVPLTLFEAGTYQLIVERENGFNTTGDFSFQVLDVAEGTTINRDVAVTDTLDSNEAVIFNYEGTAGEEIFFDNLDDDENNFVRIYNSVNQEIGGSFTGRVTLENTETYTILISGNNEENTPEDYNFQVVLPETDFATLTIGETINGNIEAAGNEDVYTFEGEAGQTLYLDGLTSLPEDSSSFGNVTFSSPSQGQIPEFFSSSTSFDFSSPFTLVENGTYSLRVEGLGETGNYSLRLLDVEEATGIDLDTTVAGTLTPGNSTNLYSFVGSKDQALFFDDSTSSNANLSIYGPGNQFIGSDSSPDIILPGDGTYVVVVQGFDGEEPVDYSFRVETPNLIADTLTIGSIVNGTISNVGEQISYSFTGTAGQRILIDGLDNGIDFEARLIPPSNQSLGSPFTTANNRGPTSLRETGTYQLIVNGNGESTGNFSLQVLDFTTATDLALDTAIEGTLATGRETQIFTFTGEAGQTLEIEDLSNNEDISYALYNGANQLLASTIESFSSSSDNMATLPGDGTYFFLVQGFSDTSVGYNFRLTETETEEPEEVSGTSIILGEIIDASISSRGEVDTYLLEATAGQTIVFDGLDDNSFSVSLRSPTATSNNFFDSSPFTLIEDGTYKLEIEGFNIGDYSFRVLDGAEAMAIERETVVKGSLLPARSAALFTFEGMANEQLFLQVDDPGSDYSAIIYGPNNQFLSSDNSSFTLPGDGTYTIIVNGNTFSNFPNNVPLNYSFQLLTPTITENTLTIGETVSGSLDEGAEVDTYTFEGEAGQILYFDGLDQNSQNNISLTSPTGGNISNFFSVSSSSNRGPFTLIETGTYTLTVEGVEGSDYSFRVLDVADSTTIELNTDIAGSLGSFAETVLFTFVGTEGQTLELEPEFSRNDYRVYSPSNEFNTFTFSGGSDFTLPGDGTYVVEVRRGFSFSSGLDYSFRIQEPNLIEESLTIGETVEGNIENAGDRLVYSFEGTVGKRLIYDGISGSFNIDAQFISPSGQNVSFSTNVSDDINPFTLEETGTYQLIIDPSGKTTGEFSFRVLDADMATTIELDTTVEGTLDPATTELFSFNGTEGQTLVLERELFNTDYTVYGPANQFIFSGGSDFTIPGDGTYLVLVRGFSSNNQPVDYSFRIEEPNVIEESLTIGETVEGSIDNVGDSIVYSFDGTLGQKLIYDGISGNFAIDTRLISPSGENLFDFFNDVSDDTNPVTLEETGTYQLIVDGNGSTTGEFSFRFLDADMATMIDFNTTVGGTVDPSTIELFSFNGTEGQTLVLERELFNSGYTVYGPSNQFIAGSDSDFTIPGDGTYLVAVRGFSFNNQPVDYSFRLEEPNLIEESLTIGETVEGSIENIGDRLVYTFDGTLGQRLIYDGISGSFNIEAQFISPSGQSVSFNTSVGSDGNPVTLQETGTYQLIVDANSSTTGDFSFRVLDANIATTIDLDTTVQGTVDPSTAALFSFEGTEGQTLVLAPELFNSSYTVYSPSNQLISSGGSEFTIPGDGTYLVRVGGFANQPSDYSFRVEEPNVIEESLTIGETVEGSIENAGDRIIYTFDGTLGQKLIYDGISGSFNIDARLISPAGQNLFGFSRDVNRDIDPLTLGETGTYQLIVDGNGSTTGDFSFRVLDANIATTIDLDTTVEGTVDPNTPTLFSFEATEGQTLVLNSELFALNYRVYSPSNEFIASSGSDFTIPGDGTYLIVETGSSSNNQPVDYRFSVIEPNVIEESLTIGETVEGSIENTGDRIIYTFDGTLGQKLIYDGISGRFGLDVELISPAGQNLFSFSRNVNSDRDPLTLKETGTYQLIVDGNGSTTGEFSFRVLDANIATTIDFNTTVEGTVEPNTPTLFSFEGTEGQTLLLNSELFGLNYRVYSPSNEFIAGVGSEFIIPGDGTYLIVETRSSSNNQPVDYRFSVIETNSIDAALTIGETVEGSIENIGDRIIHNFDATVGQKLIYDGISGDSNIDVEFISPAGQSLFGFFNPNVNSDRDPLTLKETGTYQLIVDGNGSTTGDFSFRFLDANIATTIDFNTTVEGTVEPNTPTLFSFEATEGQTLLLNSELFALNYRVYSPSNEFIAN
ncbi:hypothetical protein CWATWH0003_5022t6, partial [Crocosphaera watsonii WH 0003]